MVQGRSQFRKSPYDKEFDISMATGGASIYAVYQRLEGTGLRLGEGWVTIMIGVNAKPTED